MQPVRACRRHGVLGLHRRGSTDRQREKNRSFNAGKGRNLFHQLEVLVAVISQEKKREKCCEKGNFRKSK